MTHNDLFPPQEVLSAQSGGYPDTWSDDWSFLHRPNPNIDPVLRNNPPSDSNTFLGTQDDLQALSLENCGTDSYNQLTWQHARFIANPIPSATASSQVYPRHQAYQHAYSSQLPQFQAPAAVMTPKAFLELDNATQNQDLLEEFSFAIPDLPPENTLPQSHGARLTANHEQWSPEMVPYAEMAPHVQELPGNNSTEAQTGTAHSGYPAEPLAVGHIAGPYFDMPSNSDTSNTAYPSTTDASPSCINDTTQPAEPSNISIHTELPSSLVKPATTSRKKTRSKSNGSIPCPGMGDGKPCKRKFVPKRPTSSICSRCQIKYKRANAPTPIFSFDAAMSTFEQAKALLHHIRPALALDVDGPPPTQAQCFDLAPRVIGSFLEAASTPYVEGSAYDDFHANQQLVFNGKSLLDKNFSNQQVNMRMHLLYQTLVVLHTGGETVYPEGGDNGGYGKPDTSLGFWERVDKIVEILKLNKRVCMDVIEGRGVMAFVANPEKYQKRKTQNKESNARKQEKQKLGDVVQAKREAKGKGKGERKAKGKAKATELDESDVDSEFGNEDWSEVGNEDWTEGEDEDDGEVMFGPGERDSEEEASILYTPQSMSLGLPIHDLDEPDSLFDGPAAGTRTKRKRTVRASAAATTTTLPRRTKKAKLAAYAQNDVSANVGDIPMMDAFSVCPPTQQSLPTVPDANLVGGSTVDDSFYARIHQQVPAITNFNPPFDAMDRHELGECDGRRHMEFNFDAMFSLAPQ